MRQLKVTDMEQGYYVRRSFVEVLGLVGAERDTYAIVRAFTESERGCYIGDYRYIAAMIGKSKSIVNRALRSLVMRGFISRVKLLVGNYERVGYVADIDLEKELVGEYVARMNEELEAEQSEAEIRVPVDNFAAVRERATTRATKEKKKRSHRKIKKAAQMSGAVGRHSRPIAGKGYKKGCAADPGRGGSRSYGFSGYDKKPREKIYCEDPRSPNYVPKAIRVTPDYAEEAMRLAILRTYGDIG